MEFLISGIEGISKHAGLVNIVIALVTAWFAYVAVKIMKRSEKKK